MNRFTYTLRTFPIARFFTLVVFASLLLLLTLSFTQTVSRPPSITEISPTVGKPGDVLTIRGDFFGGERGSSYVEISGNRLTESSYIIWRENEIRVTIPANAGDGLVYVVSNGGKSNPDFFANELAIPLSMPTNQTTSLPTISNVSPERASPGQVIVITGKNFGTSRESSNVYFSSHKQSGATEKIVDPTLSDKEGKSEYIPLASKFSGFIIPSEADFDHEYWSETEIRLRVPDGAETGSLFVATNSGRSDAYPFTVLLRGGQKTSNSRYTYLIQVEANIKNIKGSKNAAITLHMPHPAPYSLQPEISLTESAPEPQLWNYNNTSIFQVYPSANTPSASVRQNFAIDCYSRETTINMNAVRAYSDKGRLLYRTYTRADEIIPANNDELKKLLPTIIGRVTNPYRQAELIFDYMTNNYSLAKKPRALSSDPLDLLKGKPGDAYDFAVIYTALLRTAGIPARMLSGILVSAERSAKNHWWTEFYIEDFGWVPVDIALAKGLEFDAYQHEQNTGKYYFGNIDAQHLAFSLNYNMIKQSLLNNKVLYVPRSFELQSVWEESSNEIESYSSYWLTPVVLGVF